MNRVGYGIKAVLFFVIALIGLVSAPALAQSAPTLDGFVDEVYYSHGYSVDYAGFYPEARAVLYVLDDTSIDANYVYIAWVITTDFNDNSYEDNRHSSWPGGHQFFDLYESDKQRLDLENLCGETVLDATMDLLDENATYGTPSGYEASFNTTEDSEQIYINGGNWDLMDYDTSLAGNLNDLGYCTGGTCACGGTDLLVNSPAWLDESTYTPVVTCSGWEYSLVWELRIHRDVFVTTNCPGGGFLGIATNPVELHASPSKIGISPVTLFKVVASIGDYVWLDTNRDGVQDVGENGLANVTVDLYSDPNGDGDTSDGTVIATTTTDTYGRYLFRDLGSGNYVVDVTDTNNVLTGLTLTTGSADPHGSIALEAQDRYLDADFGYAPDATYGAIGDYVWSDADDDGVQDPGEPGIGGVTMTLTGDTDGDGVFDDVLTTTVTRADGVYLFTGLAPGDYIVDSDTTGVLTAYTLHVGGQSSADPSDVINIEAGEVYLNADFGYNQAGLGSIGNQIWFEDDGDGAYEPLDGETGISNVTLDLIMDSNGNGVWDTGEMVISSLTASGGTYQFSGLSLDDGDGDADYLVHISDVHDVLRRYRKSTGSSPGSDNNSQADPYAVALSAASPSNQTADFGYWFDNMTGAGLVGDRVWYDFNGNNAQDDGEPGIAGVEVELWTLDKKGALKTKLGEITTDLNGDYYFPNLDVSQQGAEYAVVVTTDNFLSGGPLYGYTGTNQPDNQDESVGLTDTVTEDLTLDFGYRLDPTGGTYSIGDYVWLDGDGQGDQDAGESGFEGVTIDLYQDLNGNDDIDAGEPVIATTSTDSNGAYLFSNLPNGDYIVKITDDLDILDGYTKTAGTDNWPVNINGAGNLTIDYGYFRDDPTLAFIAPFSAYSDGGQVVVHWETAVENGTVGFNLFRLNKETGQYLPVNTEMLAGLQKSARGGIYRYVDRNAFFGGTYTYKLEEVESNGGTRSYGPFTVRVGVKQFDHLKPGIKPMRGRYSKQAHPVSQSKKARLRARQITVNQVRAQKKKRAGNAVKIAVKEKGFYYVSAVKIANTLNIAQKKIETAIRTGNLLLENQGQAVVYFPANGASGIYFYGEAIDSIYSNENIYRLTKGKGLAGKYAHGGLPAPASGDETFNYTLHIEEDNYGLTALYDDPKADYWLWDFAKGGETGKTFNVDAHGAASYGTAGLSVHLKGATNTGAVLDHHVKVSLNGNYIGESRWDGTESHSFDIYFDQSLLNNGSNTIEITAQLSDGVPYSIFHIDSFDLTYHRYYRAVNDRLLCCGDGNPVITVEGFTNPNIRVFDVTYPKQPRLVTGTSIDAANRVSFIPETPESEYVVLSANGVHEPLSLAADKPSRLRKKSNSADYVVIAAEGLEATAENLAQLRSSRGLETMVVELEDIYDEFSYGLSTPEAIKTFLAHAYHHWNGGGPKYAVLAGAGTYDYKNNMGYGGCLIPPLLVNTPFGLFAADNRFGDVVGDDGMPEITIGRLPVLTGAELQTYIDKMIDYESASGPWTGRVMMLADDPDQGGNFPVDSDYLATLFPLYTVDKIYLPFFSTIDEARQQVLSGINNGALLVNYIGHAGLTRFAKEGMLLSTDVAALQNDDRLPLFTAFTCIVGRFAIPGYDSLSEELVLKSNGGAAAVWAPSGASYNNQARKLAEGLFKALFQDQEKVLGSAILKALQGYTLYYYNDPFMMDIYNLLGDPALEIK